MNNDSNIFILHKDVIHQITSGYKVMVIMRGPPGCGKTYLARSILKTCCLTNACEDNYRDFIFSSDDYFLDSNGLYKYNNLRLEEAHSYNLTCVNEKAVEGWSPIIVDNTNIKTWEMMPYVKTAVENGYILQIIEPSTPWRYSATKLAARNVHKVSVGKIQSMLDKFEKAGSYDLIKMLKNTKYTVSLPQLRSFPSFFALPERVDEKYLFSQKTSNDNRAYFTEPGIMDIRHSPKEQRTNFRKTKKTCECIKTNLCECTFRNKPCNILNERAKSWSENKNNNKLLNNLDSTLCMKRKNMTKDFKDFEINSFMAHKIGCKNENKNFLSIRQMFPNKQLAVLWYLFVKCKGNVELVVDVLRHETECRKYDFFLNMARKQASNILDCECDMVFESSQLGQQDDPIFEMYSSVSTTESQFSQGNSDEFSIKKKDRKYRKNLELNIQQEDSWANPYTNARVEDNLYRKYCPEMLEINLGEDLITQLKYHFHNDSEICEDLERSKNFKVLMPKYLAKELYVLWMGYGCCKTESQNHQTSKENEKNRTTNSPYSLREIAATKVASTICEIGSKEQRKSLKSIGTQSENKRQQKEEFATSITIEETKHLVLKEFEKMRNYAAHHSQLKAECYQKAKQALQKGRSHIAVYYSQIAAFHKNNIDIHNHRAANCMMEVYNSMPSNSDFIDLHYLHVVEAIECLDIFIDKHIGSLKTKSKNFKHLFIITGRGLHSAGGISAIKTKVKSRLRDRNLRWTEVNPGLLKIKIFSGSKYTKNIS